MNSKFIPQPFKSALRRLARWVIGYEELLRPSLELQQHLQRLEQQLFQNLGSLDAKQVFKLKAACADPEIERVIRHHVAGRTSLGNTLELFIGSGSFVELLSSASQSYHGSDPSLPLVQYHQRMNSNVRRTFSVFDQSWLQNFARQKFNTIFAGLERARWSVFLLADLLEIASKQLTPGGELILVIPYDKDLLTHKPINELFAARSLELNGLLLGAGERFTILRILKESLWAQSPTANRFTTEINTGTTMSSYSNISNA